MAGENVQDGYTGGAAITPSDTTVFNPPFRGIYVGAGTDATTPGTIVLITPSGETLTFSNVRIGQVLPVAAQAVKAATTSTLLVGVS